MKPTALVAFALALGLMAMGSAKADTFGNGTANEFTIDFVIVGNAGNGNNTTTGFGAVPYNYRIGVYEVPQDAITKATALGMGNVTQGAGTLSASQPAVSISWYQAAAFVNWLNTSTGRQAAYNLTFTGGNWSMALWAPQDAWQEGGQNLYRHKDAYYWLPSWDESYKAAYHKNDGVTANYWAYPTGSDTAPTAVLSGTAPGTAVYNLYNIPPYPTTAYPANVNQAGGLSSYGTMGQGGNVYEWIESQYAGAVYPTNTDPNATRMQNISGLNSISGELSSTQPPSGATPNDFNSFYGFRVASFTNVPEPSTALLVLMAGGVAGGAWLFKRRSKK